MRKFKERAEALAVQIILTQLLAHAFHSNPKFAKAFTQGVEHSIDNFQFRNGWAPSDEMRGREYMRIAADEIIGPALPTKKQR